jgi:hypothetical protein
MSQRLLTSRLFWKIVVGSIGLFAFLDFASPIALSTANISIKDTLSSYVPTDKQNPVALITFARNQWQQKVNPWGYVEVFYVDSIFRCIDQDCQLDHLVVDVQASTRLHIFAIGNFYALTEYGFNVKRDELYGATTSTTDRSPYGIGGQPELLFSKIYELAMSKRTSAFSDTQTEYTLSISWKSYAHIAESWTAHFYNDRDETLQLEIDPATYATRKISECSAGGICK